jgi:putative tricarboxylic transport membrane protein
MFESIGAAWASLLNFHTLLMFSFGVVVGWIFGVLPGIGGLSALAVFVPLTYGWADLEAMYFLIGIVGSVTFTGSITSILLNTPGNPPNAATCLDGYPMAQQGKAGFALGISATASCLGALFAVIVMVALIPIMRALLLALGPPEFFWIILCGVACVAFASKGKMVKGLAAGGFGIMLSFIGFSEVLKNVTRWTAGSLYLWNGLDLVAFIVGLLAIAEMIDYSLEGGSVSKETAKVAGQKITGSLEGCIYVFKHWKAFLRGVILGTWIGIVPAVGSVTSTFMAYAAAVQSSKHPETFGHGDPEGVLAPESANTSQDVGALVPTLAFGIPGDAKNALMLGAFVLHGMQPGPLFMKEHMDVVWVLIIGVALANILTSGIGLFTAKWMAKIANLNTAYIGPVVLVLCAAGVFVTNENIWDVALCIAAGIFGYAMIRAGYSAPSIVIGFILGNLTELYYRLALATTYGDAGVFFRWTSIPFFLLVVLTLGWPLWNAFKAKMKERQGLTS